MISSALAKTSVDELFYWAENNGIFIHECLEYRDEGMFLNCCIDEKTVLVVVPEEMHLRHNGTWDSVRDNIVSHLMYPIRSDPWFTYFDFLNVKCYSAICMPETMTWIGYQMLWDSYFGDEEINDPTLLATASTMYSRIWGPPISAGMPIIDLFNYNREKHASLSYVNSSSFIITRRQYDAGEQVYWDYGIDNPNEAFIHYGIVNTTFEPSCADYSDVRWDQYPEKRKKCIADLNMTLGMAEHEFVEAIELDDDVMADGLRMWFRNYWRSDDINTLNPL